MPFVLYRLPYRLIQSYRLYIIRNTYICTSTVHCILEYHTRGRVLYSTLDIYVQYQLSVPIHLAQNEGSPCTGEGGQWAWQHVCTLRTPPPPPCTCILYFAPDLSVRRENSLPHMRVAFSGSPPLNMSQVVLPSARISIVPSDNIPPARADTVGEGSPPVFAPSSFSGWEVNRRLDDPPRETV